MDQMTNPLDKLHGYYFEDLEEGMHDVFAKTITDADIVLFACLLYTSDAADE